MRVMVTNKGNVKIDKFDDADFDSWKMQIENYLYQKSYVRLSQKRENRFDE